MAELITGISGFIGSNLAKKLIEQGREVAGIARDAGPSTSLRLLNFEHKVSLVLFSNMLLPIFCLNISEA